MTLFSKLFKDTAIYGLGSIVPRIFNFFLVPLHTRVFGPESYGQITDVYGWMGILNVIFLFGMETAYLRYATKENSNEKQVFRLAQTVVVGISLFSFVLIFSFYRFSNFSFGLPQDSNLIFWVGLTLFIDAICALPFARLRLQKKSRLFAMIKITNVAILLVLNYYFLKEEAKLEYVFLANLLANAVYLLFFFPTLMEWRPTFNGKISWPMAAYSFPVMLTGLAGMTNEMFSRISIDNWLPENFYEGKSSDYMQGIFGACYKFSILMNLVVQAFRMAAEPFFFTQAGQQNSKDLFARVNHLFTMVTTFFMMAICFNMNILRHIVDEVYWTGLNIVPVLLLGYLFLGVYYNISVWFKVTDKTYYGTIITSIGAVVTIGLNYLLIPRFGITGSSAVTFLCYFTMTLLCYWLGQKHYPIPYTIGKDFLIIFSGFLVVLLSGLVIIENQVIGIFVGLAETLAALFVFYLLEKDKLREHFL